MAGFVPDPVPFSFDGALVEAEAHKQIAALRGKIDKYKHHSADLQDKVNDLVAGKEALFKILQEEIAAGRVNGDDAKSRYQEYKQEIQQESLQMK